MLDTQADLTVFDDLWSRGIKVPVATLADLDRLDTDEVQAGYFDGRQDDAVEPGTNRTRAYWHGWKCGAADAGHREPDAAHRELVRRYCWRSARQAGSPIEKRYQDLERAHRRGEVL